MKFVMLFIGLLFTMTTISDISEVRNLYRYAKNSKENTDKFYELTQKGNHSEDPVIAAYYGCALTLKASFSEKTGDRISYFRKGRRMIEDAIESAPSNIELRMIRLSVQINAPRITRYRKNIDEDRKFLQENIDKVTVPKLKKFIQGFMTSSKAFEK